MARYPRNEQNESQKLEGHFPDRFTVARCSPPESSIPGRLWLAVPYDGGWQPAVVRKLD